MPFSAKTLETKPYNKCIDCVHIGINCDGPNFLAMSAERWCEWCHLRKEYLDWSNQQIADAAGISKTSVDRVMSGNVKDPQFTTMQAITKALVNGTWGQYPCAAEALKEQVVVDNPAIIEQCKHLQTTLDELNAKHSAEIDEIRKYEQGRIDYLKEQVAFKESQMKQKDSIINKHLDLFKRKNAAITVLGALLGISLITIITALIIDSMNPDIGFFWLDRISNIFAGRI